MTDIVRQIENNEMKKHLFNALVKTELMTTLNDKVKPKKTEEELRESKRQSRKRTQEKRKKQKMLLDLEFKFSTLNCTEQIELINKLIKMIVIS